MRSPAVAASGACIRHPGRGHARGRACCTSCPRCPAGEGRSGCSPSGAAPFSTLLKNFWACDRICMEVLVPTCSAATVRGHVQRVRWLQPHLPAGAGFEPYPQSSATAGRTASTLPGSVHVLPRSTFHAALSSGTVCAGPNRSSSWFRPAPVDAGRHVHVASTAYLDIGRCGLGIRGLLSAGRAKLCAGCVRSPLGRIIASLVHDVSYACGSCLL
jgi:hypothetical protein